jgi:hypothetical protein
MSSWILVEAVGVLVAAVTVALANASWSGGIVTVVALRTLSHHVWRRSVVDGVVNAVLVMCLPDIVAATWIAKVAVECTPIVHYNTTTQPVHQTSSGADVVGKSGLAGVIGGLAGVTGGLAGVTGGLAGVIGSVGFIGDATNRAWRLVTVLKTSFDTLPYLASLAAKPSYWAPIVSKAWHVRLATAEFHRSIHVLSPCLAIARWQVVAVLVCVCRLLRAPMAQRYAMAAWILRYHVLAKRPRATRDRR